MKRLIISLAVLAVVIGIGSFGYFFIDTEYEKITASLEKGEQAVEKREYSLAEEYCKDAEESYVKAERFLTGFVNHETLDEIGVRLAGIKGFITEDEEAEFKSHVEETKIALKHLKNDIEISLKNLF